jgi:hypothetical protein
MHKLPGVLPHLAGPFKRHLHENLTLLSVLKDITHLDGAERIWDYTELP